MNDSERLSLLSRRLPSLFERRVVALGPGGSREYDEREWGDALVIVELGEVELESTLGTRYRFARGDVLWLMGLPLRALHNAAAEPVILVAVSRRSL